MKETYLTFTPDMAVVRAFAALWDETYAHRPGLSWATSPFVWVLTWESPA